MRCRLAPSLCLVFVATVLAAQAGSTPPRLLAAEVGAAPWNVQSGGIAAYDVEIDATGTVRGTQLVQDVEPYGTILGDSLRSWRFEPARAEGRAVPSRVLVIGFFRPPGLTFAAPEAPRYKTTTAPDEIPWPTQVGVPPYPPNALGSGKVVLEVDVSDAGAVTGARVLSPPTAFDSAASGAVREWRFRPASLGNRTVASRVFMVLSFVGTT